MRFAVLTIALSVMISALAFHRALKLHLRILALLPNFNGLIRGADMRTWRSWVITAVAGGGLAIVAVLAGML